MDERKPHPPVIKVAGYVTTYVRNRAKTLLLSLRGNGQRQEISDGYIIKATRTGRTRYALIVDPPALLCLVGWFYPPTEPPTLPQDSLLLSLAAGRMALKDGIAAPLPVITNEFSTASPWLSQVLGNAPERAYRYLIANGQTSQLLVDTGIGHGMNIMQSGTNAPVNPLAFVPRGDTHLEYHVYIDVPQSYRIKFEQDGAWTRTDQPAAPTSVATRWSLLVSDSIMRTAYGALPWSLRLSPPAYDPGSTAASDYARAQAIWHSFVVERLPSEDVDGVATPAYRATIMAHCVLDMVNDFDQYGARGLWVATIKVVGDSATLVGQFMVDTRGDASVNRRPSLDVNAYRYNAHLRVGCCILNSGTAVIIDPMTIATAAGRYYSLDVHWVDRTGVRTNTQVVQNAFALYAPHDMHNPVGAATDGTVAVSINFSTLFTIAPASLDVVVITESGASIVLSTEPTFCQCLAGQNPAQLTTGADGNAHWVGVGAGGDHVRYIGNGKFAFYVSANRVNAFPARGDWALAIYDINSNTAFLAGIIDPAIVTVSDVRSIGAMDCVVEEKVDPDTGTILQYATIIVTRGGNAQAGTDPGTEYGETHISYDSGATWTQIASYGSPAGVLYCGNILSPRKGTGLGS